MGEHTYIEDPQDLMLDLNNIQLFKIDNIEKINYKGLVYDLEVENQHNYITDLGIVHNGGGI